jgi:hypothetical protein
VTDDAARAARRSFRAIFGKPGPMLSPSGRKSLWREPRWNAGRRARPQAEGGASRLTPWRVPHAACERAKDNASAGVLLPFLFRGRHFFLRHCRATGSGPKWPARLPGNPFGGKASPDLPIGLSEPLLSMDHRIKSGGDEVCLASSFDKTRTRKTRREKASSRRHCRLDPAIHAEVQHD